MCIMRLAQTRFEEVIVQGDNGQMTPTQTFQPQAQFLGTRGKACDHLAYPLFINGIRAVIYEKPMRSQRFVKVSLNDCPHYCSWELHVVRRYVMFVPASVQRCHVCNNE